MLQNNNKKLGVSLSIIISVTLICFTYYLELNSQPPSLILQKCGDTTCYISTLDPTVEQITKNNCQVWYNTKTLDWTFWCNINNKIIGKILFDGATE